MPSSRAAGGNEAATGQYALRSQQSGQGSFYDLSRHHEPAAADPVYGAPNSRFKTEGVPDSGQKDKIEVFFLPPYAPEYNPDEYLNHALKISVHSGQLPYTREDLCHKF